jgi:chromate reductase
LINILAISGSLRSNSSNNAVISLVARMVPESVSITIYDGLGSLPHFDDRKDPPTEVHAWRDQLRDADGIIICSPEYAFGVPGSLKNALDWTVASGELVHKPLALITAATGGDKAHAALMFTFQALSANMPPENTLLISYIRSKMNEKGEVTDHATIDKIKAVIDALVNVIVASKD